MSTRTLTNVVCAGCGCVCDDLRVTLDGDRVTRIEPHCPHATTWFDRPELSSAEDVKAGVDAAAALLRTAKAPLILGRSIGVKTARAAVALAERLGGIFDPGGDAAATAAFQLVGKSTCTLGEMRERCDLVVLWGVDPDKSHPRFRERFIAADSTVVSQPAPTYEQLTALRAALADGVSEENPLAAQLQTCRAGAFVFGNGLPTETVAALFSLTRDLNARTRFYVCELRGECGGEAAGTWLTGYAGGVDFSPGYPREASAERVLSRGEADVAIVLGDQSTARLSAAAQANLARIPRIRVHWADESAPAAVRILTAKPGVDAPGVAYRLDDVPLPLRAILPPSRPTASEVLARIHAAL